MLHYVAGRLLQAIIAVFGVLTIVFIVMRFSGDPTLLLVPEGASPESIDALRTELGFDRPVIVQYIDYLRSLSHLDFGVSVVQRIPAFDIVASRIPYTVLLATGALVIAVGVGIPVGIAMAVWRGGWLERLLAAVVLTGQSMPTFLSGILLILVFGVMLGWLPTSGAGDLKALVLPSIALGALSMATFARMARTAIVDELGKDYVRAGRARGLSPAGIVFRHVLRNAAIPVVQVIVLLISIVYVGTSLLADVAYALTHQVGAMSLQATTSLRRTRRRV